MANISLATQTGNLNVQEQDFPLLEGSMIEKEAAPQPRVAIREIPGVNIGQVTIIKDRGWNREVEKGVFDRKDWVKYTVREREVVGINGVKFVVEGPRDDDFTEDVTLPAPIANVLKERDLRHKEAMQEWRSRTSNRIKGGRLPDRDY